MKLKNRKWVKIKERIMMAGGKEQINRRKNEKRKKNLKKRRKKRQRRKTVQKKENIRFKNTKKNEH